MEQRKIDGCGGGYGSGGYGYGSGGGGGGGSVTRGGGVTQFPTLARRW